ncbi:carbohydrate esterase family 16 protein [Amanita thiersii Skay4041]|uniref:Carbohydrate esterase family 16 protein n=1 Tax=Amanita thiersii Skay4041 TaxID=703135 RepID=A0A2A9NMD6_9AGAR|nr:carbohydrate esterase family 16 protein [Amanita thiersii Skay4041]
MVNSFFLAPIVAVLSVIPTVFAQSPVWGQCGGIGWTGPTTCVSGTACTYVNDWYSQCIPGATSTTVVPTTTTPTSTPTSTVKANYWFSFGDSYTQTGFNSTGILPAPGNPLGNPPYPGWTATGGENWVDYVTTKNNRSMVLTYNFAYGGATIDANLVQPYQPTVLSLTDQVNIFLNGFSNKPASTPWTSSNALFSVWIGINDIGNSFYLSGDRDAFSDTLLNAYFALVQKLYNVGGRNFLFVNVPPIDRSPLMLAQPASSQSLEKSVIAGFNSKLQTRITSFKSSHSGVQTWLWDSNASFTTILNSPTTYGFRDATSYGSSPDLFWGNDYHPSSTAHKIFGQQVGTLLGGTVW